jgi:hypothetical protein
MAEDQTRGPSGNRLRKQGEEAIGEFAQELLQSPVVSGAISTAFETRERATRAQEVAMSALNLPSAADIERLTRRVRSISQRMEGLEDNLDKLNHKLDSAGSASPLEGRLSAIEETLARIEAGLAAGASEPEPGPDQTELPVED